MIIYHANSTGRSVAVNPRLVTKIAINALNEDWTLIYFGKDDFISVNSSFDEVLATLAEAAR